MLKKILLSSMLSIVATGAFAVSSTVTSKDYVDDLVATKQAKIPAAGATGVGAGETIITYTGASGTIGERGIYNDASSYDATTDADKIITASALNGAVSNISTTETSKLTCYDANCTLWSIGTQTAYGMTPIDWSARVSINGTGHCDRRLSGLGYVTDDPCSAETLSYIGATDSKSGKWGTVFPYGDVYGKSVCSTISSGDYAVATDAQTTILDDEFASQTGVGGNTGGYCWCKMESPAVSKWVFRRAWNAAPADNCATYCAAYCGGKGNAENNRGLRTNASLRAAMFGSIQ